MLPESRRVGGDVRPVGVIAFEHDPPSPNPGASPAYPRPNPSADVCVGLTSSADDGENEDGKTRA